MKILTTVIFALLALVFTVNCQAWDINEHRQLGDSVYFSVLDAALPDDSDSGLANDLDIIFSAGTSFGRLCARLAADDLARDRFHRRGLSILDQLRYLPEESIDSAWRTVSNWAQRDTASMSFNAPPKLRSDNVVCAYLLYHLMALRMVKHAFDEGADSSHLVREAILLEAAAQGYLADAFAAGHILTPVSDWLAALHPRNTIETHNHFRNCGAYVIDSHGHVWQTFGDRLMQWYAPTYRRVFAACRASFMEFYAAYVYASGARLPEDLRQWFTKEAHNDDAGAVIIACLESHDGYYYYMTRLVPTLSLIPMPVAASWSYRSDVRDEHGSTERFHYPQLRGPGLHDPDLENIDGNFLYPLASVPEWLVPPPFRDSVIVSPEYLIKYDADWASVRWVQDRSAIPSYKGLLVILDGQSMGIDNHYEQSLSFGLGYGFWDDLIIAKSLSASVALTPSAYESNRLLLTPSVGFTLPVAAFAQMNGIRIEGGAVFGLKSAHDHAGGLLACGLDSKPLRLGFTNAGLTFRFKYQWYILERTMHGPALELILH